MQTRCYIVVWDVPEKVTTALQFNKELNMRYEKEEKNHTKQYIGKYIIDTLNESTPFQNETFQLEKENLSEINVHILIYYVLFT